MILTRSDVQRLTRALGRVPQVEGLSREEILALAALGRRPLGLASARAVARAAGISPVSAAKAMEHLSSLGYLEKESRQLIEGRVKTLSLWQVRWTSPAWLRVAPALASVVFPEPVNKSARPSHLPRRLSHLFWDVPRPTAIDLRKSGPTVASRLLMSNDPQALAWAAQALRPSDLREGARMRGVDNRTRALAENLAE